MESYGQEEEEEIRKWKELQFLKEKIKEQELRGKERKKWSSEKEDQSSKKGTSFEKESNIVEYPHTQAMAITPTESSEKASEYLLPVSRKKTFKKRAGTTDRGKKYEDLMVANLILQLVNNNSYSDFKISSNDASFGDFDDVVVELDGINQVVYAVQLKHFERTKAISLDSLEANSGNFSIKKYFDSYTKQQNLSEFKLILYTNSKFNPDYNRCIKLEMEGKEFDVVIVKTKAEPLLITNQNSQNCYQFEIVKNRNCDTQTLAKCEDFFKEFYLYPNQANVDSLNNDLQNKMCEFFSSDTDVIDKYLKFLNQWSECDGVKVKLTKKMMQERLALYLTASSIHPIVFGPVSKNGKILQEAISKFPVTAFNNDKVEQVRRIWGDVIDKQLDLNVLNQKRKKHQISSDHVDDITQLSNKDCTYLLWLMDKCPLIVSENCQVYEAIKLCKRKPFVVIRDTNSKSQHSGYFRIFEKLSDLKIDSNIWTNVIQNFSIQLSATNVNLEHLIKENHEFEDITIDELLSMVNGPYKIEFQNDDLSTPYINRSIECPLLDIKSVDVIDPNAATIISNVDIKNRALFKNFELVDTTEFLNGNINSVLRLEMRERRKIYVSRDLCSEEIIECVCERAAEQKANRIQTIS